jgi:hypothetical protein
LALTSPTSSGRSVCFPCGLKPWSLFLFVCFYVLAINGNNRVHFSFKVLSMEILIFKTLYPTQLAVRFYELVEKLAVENAQVTVFHTCILWINFIFHFSPLVIYFYIFLIIYLQ